MESKKGVIEKRGSLYLFKSIPAPESDAVPVLWVMSPLAGPAVFEP
jgi:hypothetical protein